MKGAASVLGLVIVLAIGYWIYKAELVPGPQGGTPLVQQADVTGVTSDLISIGQAEKLYLASHGSYATFDQLREEGSIAFGGSRHGYHYSIEVEGAGHFKAVAVPEHTGTQGWPTLAVDENLQVTRE